MKRFLQVWCFLGVLGFIVALYLFPSVMPLLHLSITMNRSEALQKAADFVQSKGFQTADVSSVAMFTHDENVQNFAELEGGGKDAFVQMFEKDYYQPYYWKVRFYKEQAIEETEVIFTPQGQLYGYEHKLSENTQGNSLSLQDAQKKAEEELAVFGVDFSKYTLVEHTQDEVISKRLDHVFTYERTDVSIQDGKYRIAVKVAGDQVVSCKHFVKIPDAFARTYQEMRSSNKLLGMIGWISVYLVYALLCGLFIAYTLYRTRYFAWKIPFYIALFFGFVIGIGLQVNQYPLWGFSYQTNMPYLLFLGVMISSILFSAFVAFVGTFLVCLLGEGITRMVCGNQVQLWDFFKPGYLRSTLFIQHVAWAYGFVGIFCFYEIVFQFITSQYAGWWMPASDLSDVNILSTFIPWFAPVTQAFQAGFTEELLCRAIPLGLLLWFVPDVKKRPFLFFSVMLIQSVIFGLLHAPYPMQPSYARVIELIPISFAFGYVYCFVGLIPGIMAHYVYDVLLMSIPLFISDFVIQKIIALFFIVLPLLLALYSYARGLIVLDSVHLNSSWNAFYKEKEEKQAPDDEYSHMPKTVRYIILACGVLGIFGAYQYRQTSYDLPVLEITKSEAIKIAQDAFVSRFHVSLDSWETCVLMSTYNNSGLNFIWKVYGKDAFIKMQDRYNFDPAWVVRCIRFDTDVAHRAEEYQAFVGPKKGQLLVKKTVPEEQEGACLNQEQAIAIAYDYLKENFSVEKSEIEFISAFEKDHVHRKDWNFVFKDAAKYYSFDKGQGRLEVNIAGDQVIRAVAQIYPGEQWLRDQQTETTLKWLIQALCMIIVWAVASYSWVACAWKIFRKSQFSYFLIFWMPIFVPLVILSAMNSLPVLLSQFNTIQPYSHQIMQTILFMVLGVCGMLAGRILNLAMFTEKYSKVSARNYLPAAEFGIFLYAVASFLDTFFWHNAPSVSSIYSFATYYSVGLGIGGSFFGMCLVFSAMYLGLVYYAHRFTGFWLRSILLFVFGTLSVACMLFAQNIYYLADIPLIATCLGTALFAGYYFVFRYDLMYVFVSFAVWFFIDLVQNFFIHDIPGSENAYFMGLVVFAGAIFGMLWLFEKFSRRK